METKKALKKKQKPMKHETPKTYKTMKKERQQKQITGYIGNKPVNIILWRN